MSRAKLSLLVVGFIAAAAVVFVGANHLSASSSKEVSAKVSACEGASQAKTASSCPASACTKSTKTAGVSKSCPYSATVAGGGKDCSVKDCSMSAAACAKACGEKNVKTANIESVNEREGKQIVLAGHYVCGHCELGVAGACQPAFQTKDGKNYLLVKNNLSRELRSKAQDANVEIVTRVKRLDGTKYLEVEAIRSAS
jgi:hypothetical protein